MTRTGRLCTTRTIRLRSGGDVVISSMVMGAPIASSGAANIASSRCWLACTENSGVSKRSIGDWSARAIMPRPLRKHAVRCAGQRWPRSTTRCLPRRYRTATASKGTATSGSKLQSSSTDRRVGGGTTWPGAGPASAGTAAGPASNASASAGAFQAVRVGFHRSMTAPSYARGTRKLGPWTDRRGITVATSCNCTAKLCSEMATSTDSAIALLREQGMRMSPQRIAIVTEIMTTPGYVIPMQVIRQIQERVPGTSASTVYRTLERLEQVGVLVHVHLEGGIGYHRLADVQHVHLTCAGCGAERELPASALERLQRLIVDDHGFWPDFSHHAISGLCATCREQQGSAMAAHAHRDPVA